MANKEQERRVKQFVGGIGDLETEQIEDIVIGAETELAQRDQRESPELTHITMLKDEIDEAHKLWGKVSGLSTGLPKLDSMIGGLKKGELILIGGETNNGKSALAQNISVNVAKSGTGVLFITLEMMMTEAGSRMKHMNGGEIDDLNLMFQTNHDIDYKTLEPLFKQGIEDGCELVVLDYLQYLGRGMTLDEVAKMSKLMKKLAMKYEVPFIVIVSLRKSDGGKFKRKWTEIETEDLMGTSAIGYDADVALVASRKDENNEFDSDHFYVKVIKARNMPIDYNKRIIRFDWNNTRITPETFWPGDTGGYEPDKD